MWANKYARHILLCVTMRKQGVIDDHIQAINSCVSLSRHELFARFAVGHNHNSRKRRTIRIKLRLLACRAYKRHVHTLRQLIWTDVLHAVDWWWILHGSSLLTLSRPYPQWVACWIALHHFTWSGTSFSISITDHINECRQGYKHVRNS